MSDIKIQHIDDSSHGSQFNSEMSLSDVIEVALSKNHTENESKLEGDLKEANSKI